jgi:hypothetical protein
MNNKKNAWVPVLAPLLSIVIDQESPDMVLNDFMAVGFNFQLPPELQAGYGPRKRAYVAEVQAWIDDLEWTSQWDLARALALRLSENRAHLVHQRLAGVGWRLDGTQFLPMEKGDTDQHAFFPAGAVHDAFVHIRSLFKGASKEIFVIDGYVDSSLFQFLLSTNSPKTCRILTKSRQLPKDFIAETKAFVAQHGLPSQYAQAMFFTIARSLWMEDRCSSSERPSRTPARERSISYLSKRLPWWKA